MKNKKLIYLIGISLLLILLITLMLLSEQEKNLGSSLTQRRQSTPALDSAELSKNLFSLEEETLLLTNLTVPWEIAFLPNGDYLVTERSGNLVILREGEIKKIEIEGVLALGEGGLLGLALDPKFEENQYLYLYYTVDAGINVENRVDRYVFAEDSLDEKSNIIDGIPGAKIHNGGRIKFGPDAKLYITTGDAAKPSLAQNVNSLAGKILRINSDGTIPEDNPFENAVFSYGHRNPQGLAWDSEGNLWSTEHGPAANDELNQIFAGENYGWPVIVGKESTGNMRTPVLTSGESTTWAPSGAEYYNGKLYFAGLRSQTLYSVNLGEDKLVTAKKISETYGRLRFVSLGPNGFFYIGTSNRDGRGSASDNDDKVIRLATE